MTPPQFEGLLRGDIVRSQLQTALVRGALMPRGLSENLLRISGEMREVSYVLLDLTLAGDVPAPDNATLQKFVNANKAAYSTPELRTFSVMMFKPDDFAARAPITDAELQDAYKAQIDTFTTPETRSEREITFPRRGLRAGGDEGTRRPHQNV